MSYSRWGDSIWYTFWEIQPDDDTETYDNAIFCVDCKSEFTAKNLRDDRQGCLNAVKIVTEHVTNDEMQELSSYMDEFLEDIEKEYKKR